MRGRPRVLHKEIDSVESKQCFRCKGWFPFKLFGRQEQTWDGLRVICKACGKKADEISYIKYSNRRSGYYATHKDQKKEYSKFYRERNKDQLAAWHAKNYKKNKDKILKAAALRRKNSPEKVKRYKKAAALWRKNNPEKIKKYARAADRKKCSAPKGRISDNISRSIRAALKGNKAGRHWESLVGYTLDQLYRRLRYTIPEGYAWRDYLDGKLHIDHKIPVSVFNFEKPEDTDFQRCFALKNLQLLPARENIIKSNKLEGHFQPSLKF